MLRAYAVDPILDTGTGKGCVTGPAANDERLLDGLSLTLGHSRPSGRRPKTAYELRAVLTSPPRQVVGSPGIYSHRLPINAKVNMMSLCRVSSDL
jgi:hypothetical protein